MRVAVPERLLSMPSLAVLVLNRSRQILMGCRLVNEERAEGLGLDWFRCSMSVKYANCCACPPTPSKGAARTRVGRSRCGEPGCASLTRATPSAPFEAFEQKRALTRYCVDGARVSLRAADPLSCLCFTCRSCSYK